MILKYPSITRWSVGSMWKNPATYATLIGSIVDAIAQKRAQAQQQRLMEQQLERQAQKDQLNAALLKSQIENMQANQEWKKQKVDIERQEAENERKRLEAYMDYRNKLLELKKLLRGEKLNLQQKALTKTKANQPKSVGKGKKKEDPVMKFYQKVFMSSINVGKTPTDADKDARTAVGLVFGIPPDQFVGNTTPSQTPNPFQLMPGHQVGKITLPSALNIPTTPPMTNISPPSRSNISEPPEADYYVTPDGTMYERTPNGWTLVE